jgi:hypothetical protein
MGKMQRTKGQVGEREFAKLIQTTLGVECARRIEQTRDSGHDLDLYDYAIEVKRAKKMSLSGWWDQTARNAAAAGKTPVLAYRLDNQKWQVVMSFRDTLWGYKGCKISDLEKTVTFRLDGWFDFVKSGN